MTNSLRRTLLMLNAKLAAAEGVKVTMPDVLREHPDGTPAGVGAFDLPVDLAGVTVTTNDLAAAGLTPADVPYIRTINVEGDPT